MDYLDIFEPIVVIGCVGFGMIVGACVGGIVGKIINPYAVYYDHTTGSDADANGICCDTKRKHYAS